MQLAKATTLLASTYASCFLAMVMCAESVKAATFSLRGGDDNAVIKSSRFLIDEDEDVEILTEDVEGHYLVRVTDHGQEAGPDEEDSNIEINGAIYEIDSADLGGKKIKSGDTVVIPKGAVLGKSGKASTNGAMIKTKEEDGGGKKKKKKKRERQRGELFDRYLKTTRTDEQERNVEQLHRHLYSTTFGDKTVVAVKVVVSDGAYSSGDGTEAHLRNKVFGTNGDEFNLKIAYAQCSANQLTFNPKEDTSGNGASINNGVVTITLPSEKVADGDGAIRNAVTAKLQDVFDNDLTSVADYWMYCLPSGALSGVAYAYINSYISVYNNEWCDRPSAQVHEIGHNLNFAHSNEGGNTYEDQTGMMGYSYGSDEGPVMCFNAAKSWQSQWYTDKSIEMDTGCQTVRLSGIADYSDTPNKVLVKINKSGDDLFIAFNAKKGINSGTQEAGDQVTVVEAGAGGTGYAESTLLAKLSGGQSYSSGSISIQVNNIVGSEYADVSISLTDDCNAPTPNPTSAPTCGNGEMMKVTIGTDNYPGETTWQLTNTCTNQVIMSGGPYATSATEYVHTDECVPEGKYEFSIQDAYGDGICCGYGSGSFDVQYKGTTVASGGEFASSDVKSFGSCTPASPPPTPQPSKQPTPLPSNSPTPPPTPQPVSPAPTSPPTLAPTSPPTPQPTSSAPTPLPTPLPTNVPTPLPTNAPVTPAPTSPPTFPPPTPLPTPLPTNAPTTAAPTPLPTHLPTNAPTTAAPTPVPTPLPTNAPTTKAPTPVPTPQPSPNPTPLPTNAPTLSPNACILPTTPTWLTIGTNGEACSELRDVGINDELTFLFYSDKLTVQNAINDLKKIVVEYKVFGDTRTKWRIESDFFNGENQRPYATTDSDGVLRFSQTMFVNQLEGIEAGVWLEWKWKVELNSGFKVEYREDDPGSGGVIYVQ